MNPTIVISVWALVFLVLVAAGALAAGMVIWFLEWASDDEA